MPALKFQAPKYRKHRASGQAIVSLNGKDHYLGPHGTRASKQLYDQLLAEWLAGGRRSLDPDAPPVTVVELIAGYLEHVDEYHASARPGTPSKEPVGIREAMRPLKRLFGRTPAGEFGPLRLRAVREELIKTDLCLTTINTRIGRIKRLFRWAAANELVPASVFQALQTVEGLRRGRSPAKDPRTVKSVPDAMVDATLPHVSHVVAAMIQLQRLTGMRSGELTILRGQDIDMSGKVWLYRPASHKTAHHGHQRSVYIGPEAQAVIQPFLKRDLAAYLFSPRESEEARRMALHRDRKTPMSCGNKPGTNRRRRPLRRPQDHYTSCSYRRAIERACEKAFPPPEDLCEAEQEEWKKTHRWHPHQLRHNAATRLRKEFGIEAARVVLGHRSAAVTEIYAELDGAKAAEIMARVG